jgi:hypothetical protein
MPYSAEYHIRGKRTGGERGKTKGSNLSNVSAYVGSGERSLGEGWLHRIVRGRGG